MVEKMRKLSTTLRERTHANSHEHHNRSWSTKRETTQMKAEQQPQTMADSSHHTAPGAMSTPSLFSPTSTPIDSPSSRVVLPEKFEQRSSSFPTTTTTDLNASSVISPSCHNMDTACEILPFDCGLSSSMATISPVSTSTSSPASSSFLITPPRQLEGQAQDVLVVRGPQGSVTTEFRVTFPNLSIRKDQEMQIQVFLNGKELPELAMIMLTRTTTTTTTTTTMGKKMDRNKSQKEKTGKVVLPSFVDTNTLVPSEKALETLVSTFMDKQREHDDNKNNSTFFGCLRFQIQDNSSATVSAYANARLFVWDATTDRVVVCDIDGTVTRSNVRGVWDTVLTKSYRYLHTGVCALLNKLSGHGANIRIMYLTSRPVDISNLTRQFLQSVRQTTVGLPAGPLVSQNQPLARILFSELVTKDVHLFKSKALIGVRDLFRAATGNQQHNPFIAGFGNTDFDTLAYDTAGVPLLYQIDKSSRISLFHTIGDDKDGNGGDGDGDDDHNDETRRQRVQREERRKKSLLRRNSFRKTQKVYSRGYSDPELLKDFRASSSDLLAMDGLNAL